MNGDQPDDGDRSELAARLSAAFDHELEPAPPLLLAAARDAFSWRLADAQLAELLFDSSSDELVGIRGTSTDRRSFRYAAGDFVIRVHLAPTTMIVMLEPPVSVACRVSTDTGTDDLRTDELGELAIDPPELPFRFEFELPSGRFVTPWITG
jgi:hypothetical protein